MMDTVATNLRISNREVNFPQNYSLSNLMSQGKDLCHCTNTKLLFLPPTPKSVSMCPQLYLIETKADAT